MQADRLVSLYIQRLYLYRCCMRAVVTSASNLASVKVQEMQQATKTLLPSVCWAQMKPSRFFGIISNSFSSGYCQIIAKVRQNGAVIVKILANLYGTVTGQHSDLTLSG